MLFQSIIQEVFRATLDIIKAKKEPDQSDLELKDELENCKKYWVKQIKEFEKHGKKGCVYFIPLVNPDGVEIVEKGKPLYKANAREVDLNVNFDADWGKGKYNQKFKGDANFIGEKPFSEPETIALKEFTLKVKPDMTFSYHSKGEEIYYSFFILISIIYEL